MKVRIDALTRVEGEGSLEVFLRNGRPESLRLSIYEPPRFIEGILRGKPYYVIPDITARICGICPVAYQMSGVQAVEDAFGVKIPEDVEKVRRLMYFGEWIQSHALHVFFLHLPDFFRVPSVLELSKVDRELVLAGMEIKRAGSLIIQTLGGRTSHPVSVVPGGFSHLPESLTSLKEVLEKALDKAMWATERLAELHFPELELSNVLFVSLLEEDYPILKGNIHLEGERISPRDFKDFFVEFEVPYSTAKHAMTKDGKVYVVGPLSRFNNAFERLSTLAREMATKVGLEPPVRNPYRSLLVRMIELVHSLERAVHMVREYRRPEVTRVKVVPKSSEGYGVSEAPRGILWHHYAFDEEGRILSADIVPPTSQNQRVMELVLWEFIRRQDSPTEELLRDQAEPIIRSFDPCISCATHFLRVNLKYA
ncbi:MAG: Ni/Fe hydrogenase subunit alpha [Aquificaceae bacterium]|uniref:Ni/Fe hydrogenase subunit alpha n=1 Tax=Hydrogenobacter sp. Uz 6-8 TaxID=3384828 RepID=UPI0030A83CDC